MDAVIIYFVTPEENAASDYVASSLQCPKNNKNDLSNTQYSQGQ